MGLALAQKTIRAGIAELRRAAQLDPSQFMARERLGTIYLGLGNVKQAEMEFTESLTINPRFPPAHAGLAVILEGQGRLDEAIEHYSEALKAGPDAFLHSRLANLYVRQGRIQEAAAQFEAAVRLNPRDASSEYNLAVACERLGKLDDAIERYVGRADRPEPREGAQEPRGGVLLQGAMRTHGRKSPCAGYGGTPPAVHKSALAENADSTTVMRWQSGLAQIMWRICGHSGAVSRFLNCWRFLSKTVDKPAESGIMYIWL
jgi:tetratricopeptide (TPR) repeat protein